MALARDVPFVYYGENEITVTAAGRVDLSIHWCGLCPVFCRYYNVRVCSMVVLVVKSGRLFFSTLGSLLICDALAKVEAVVSPGVSSCCPAPFFFIFSYTFFVFVVCRRVLFSGLQVKKIGDGNVRWVISIRVMFDKGNVPYGKSSIRVMFDRGYCSIRVSFDRVMFHKDIVP